MHLRFAACALNIRQTQSPAQCRGFTLYENLMAMLLLSLSAMLSLSAVIQSQRTSLDAEHMSHAYRLLTSVNESLTMNIVSADAGDYDGEYALERCQKKSTFVVFPNHPKQHCSHLKEATLSIQWCRCLPRSQRVIELRWQGQLKAYRIELQPSLTRGL